MKLATLKSHNTAGQAAYMAGKALSDNPHEAGTDPHRAWQAGWRVAASKSTAWPFPVQKDKTK